MPDYDDLTAAPDREWGERMRTGAMTGWEREWRARLEAEASTGPAEEAWQARALVAEAELARLREAENFRDATKVSEMPSANHLTCPACGFVNIVAGWYMRPGAAGETVDNGVLCAGCEVRFEPKEE